jgi:hypothetical protein
MEVDCISNSHARLQRVFGPGWLLITISAKVLAGDILPADPPTTSEVRKRVQGGIEMRHLHTFLQLAMHSLATACLLVLFAGAACAYTIVLRDGRRVEIPAQFSVTKTTLTYEVAPGFQKSLLMAAIDVAATERANGDQPGSLIGRANKAVTQQQQPASLTTARAVKMEAQRSITNRELESYARVRHESEQAYDRQQKELGLPSLAELRQQKREEAERLRQELEEKRRRDAEAEQERRNQELEAELAAIAEELGYIRSRLDSSVIAGGTGVLPFGLDPFFNSGFGGFDGFKGFHRFRDFHRFGTFHDFGNFHRLGTFHDFGNFHRFGGFRRRIFVAPRGVVPLTRHVGFRGGPVRGGIFVNPGGGFGMRRPFR